MDSDVLLAVEKITKDYPGTRALSDVSLNVRQGEIHGIIGENGAGKSTLMNLISGVESPTEGKIFFQGNEVHFNTPEEAQRLGIGFVHQELSLCQHLSVAENIYIGRLPKKKSGFINFPELNKKCSAILHELCADIDPSCRTGQLNVADQQIVEIGKVLSLNCKLIIFDEPTSSLTDEEAEVLFGVIRHLKDKGIGILYISHRLKEIFEQCDRITVLRDGHVITTADMKHDEVDFNTIIQKMVGREIGNMYTPKARQVGEELLRVEGFSSAGVFRDVSFSLKKGEILGFSGLIGAGRTEVMRAVCAIDPKDRGEVYLEGRKIEIPDYYDSIKHGIVYLTEDRKEQGLFLKLNILSNISAACLYKVKKGLLINKTAENKIGNDFVNRLGIKVTGMQQLVNSLSGGNQQKLLIAKWMAVDPKIIIMDEPTRGIDVGAKAEIYNLLRSLAESGIGIIMVSSELPEIIGMCDRVIVMHEGSITGELTGEDIQEQVVMKYASQKFA